MASSEEEKAKATIYFAGWHMVPCLYAPEMSLEAMLVNDIVISSASIPPGTGFPVTELEIFGGLEKEGGVFGTFEFQDGNPNQEPSTYLVEVLGEAKTPAYRGVASVIARKPYLQANNPYLFPYKFKINSFHADWQIPLRKISDYVTKYEVVDNTPYYNGDDNPNTCTYENWEQGNCQIVGYPDPDTFPNGALIDDPGSWICASFDPESGLNNICLEHKFVGDGVGTTPGPTTETVETTELTVIGTNGAHIAREVLVNKDWGLGLDAAEFISETYFAAAAQTLFDEKLALSMPWDLQTSVEDFLQVVMDHIGGILSQIPGTKQYALILIRDNQTPTLSIASGNVLSFDEYEQKGWAGVTNELTVKYTDIEDGKSKSVTVHDLAAIERQGGVISETRDYPALPTLNLAEKIARRDLSIITSSGAKILITTDRVAYTLVVGELFELTYPAYGLDRAVFRAVDIDYGQQDKNEITISAISDSPVSTIFQLPPTVLGNPPAEAPYTAPINVNPRAIYEAPYWHVAKSITATGFPDMLSDSESFVMAIGGKPQSVARHFTSLFQKGSDPQEAGSKGGWSGSVVTLFSLTELETQILLDRTYFNDLSKFVAGTLAILGKTEIVEVAAIDAGDMMLTVNRGMLDTVPVSHAAGVTINTLGYEESAVSYDTWMPGDACTAWLQTVTNTGVLPLADTSSLNLQIVGSRQGRPLPPGGAAVNGEYLGSVFTGALTVSWAGRNRLTQTSDDHLTQQDLGTVPEDDTEYKLRLYGDAGTLLRSETLLKTPSGGGFDYPVEYEYSTVDEIADTGTGDVNYKLRFVLSTERDGFPSWTSWDHTCYRTDSTSVITLTNGNFASGLIAPWSTEFGDPSIRPLSELPFSGDPNCGGSAYVLGNSADNLDAPWAAAQVIDLRQYVQQAGIEDGLTMLNVSLSHRADTHGSVGKVRVDYYDVTQAYLSSGQEHYFYFQVGSWGGVSIYSENPPDAVFAKVVITELSGSPGTQIEGYVGCVSVNIYGWLGEPVSVTAMSPYAVVQSNTVEDSDLRVTGFEPFAIVGSDSGVVGEYRTTVSLATAITADIPVVIPAISGAAITDSVDVRIPSVGLSVIVSI